MHVNVVTDTAVSFEKKIKIKIGIVKVNWSQGHQKVYPWKGKTLKSMHKRHTYNVSVNVKCKICVCQIFP